MKKALIVAAVVLVVGILAYVYRLKIYVTKNPKPETLPPGEVVAPPVTPNAVTLNRLTGEGKTIFDAYYSKFSRNQTNLAEALASLDPNKIFKGTKDAFYKDPFLQSAQQIPQILSPVAVQKINSLSQVLPTGSDIWAKISAVRSANYAIQEATGVNLLPGEARDKSDVFAEKVACAYVGCKKNDKDRNAAANGAMPQVSAEFQTILKQWKAYNEEANYLLEQYTIQQLNAAGYKIV